MAKAHLCSKNPGTPSENLWYINWKIWQLGHRTVETDHITYQTRMVHLFSLKIPASGLFSSQMYIYEEGMQPEFEPSRSLHFIYMYILQSLCFSIIGVIRRFHTCWNICGTFCNGKGWASYFNKEIRKQRYCIWKRLIISNWIMKMHFKREWRKKKQLSGVF